MTRVADPSLLDNLWYFDSVVRSKPQNIAKRAKSSTAKHSAAAGAAEDGDTSGRESQLPLSTGGEELGGAEICGSSCCMDSRGGDGAGKEGDSGSYCGNCERCMKSSNSPSMCELVEKMEEGTGELSAKELRLWMQKLGLDYTADGAMIRRTAPNTQLSSQQKLDFSEFVCLNRFIEDERLHIDDLHHGGQDNAASFSDAHMASLYEVFHLFDRDDNGLISPAELRAALAKLGLRNAMGS